MTPDGLRAWADALSREWPVSSDEIVEMHRKLDLVGMKSWRIPWLIQELLRGKRICFMSTEQRALGPRSSGKSTTIAAQRRRERWLNDVLSPTRDEPIKLRRRTIDVPEVAALLLPKEEPIRRDPWDLKNWSPLMDRDNPLRISLEKLRLNIMGR